MMHVRLQSSGLVSKVMRHGPGFFVRHFSTFGDDDSSIDFFQLVDVGGVIERLTFW